LKKDWLSINKDKESFLVVPLLALKMKMSEIAWSNQERHGTFGRLFLLLRDFELDDAPKGLLNCLFYMFTRHCH
jgi:hypothetical protein